jgi:hypothetical protein
MNMGRPRRRPGARRGTPDRIRDYRVALVGAVIGFYGLLGSYAVLVALGSVLAKPSPERTDLVLTGFVVTGMIARWSG